MSAELTEPGFTKADGPTLYRGVPYSALEPLLITLGHEVGDDVKDWQLVYVGYSPASDTFVVAFDLWLSEGVDADGEPLMACSSVTCRVNSKRVKTSGEKYERLPPGFSGEKVRARLPDLIDLHLQ